MKFLKEIDPDNGDHVYVTRVEKNEQFGEYPVRIDYINWQGEVQTGRLIHPIRIWFGSTPFYAAQWILDAYCYDKWETRSFALKNISKWAPP